MLDETGSWGISKDGIIAAIRTCVYAQGQGPLYFAILSVWLHIFGESVLALRSLSILLYALAVFLFTQAMRHTSIQRWVIFGSTLVWLISHTSLSYSFLARPYALAIAIISLGAWVSASKNYSLEHQLLLGMIGTAMFYTHYLFIIPLILTCGIVSVLSARLPIQRHLAVKRAWAVSLALTAGAILAALIVAPMFLMHLSNVSELRFLRAPLFGDIYAALAGLPLFPIGAALFMCIALQEQCIALKAGTNGLLELALAIAMPIGLFICSHILDATLMAPQHYGVALPLTLIFLMKGGDKLAQKRPLLVAILFLLQICWGLFGAQDLKNLFLKRSLPREVRTNLYEPPQRFARCGLFISSGFMESVSYKRMHNPLLLAFLRAPISYYFKGNFNLLPVGFLRPEDRVEFISSITDAVTKRGCALLAFQALYHWNEKIVPALNTIPSALIEAGLSVNPLKEAPWSYVVYGSSDGPKEPLQ